MELSNLASVEQTQNAASTNDITQKTNGSSAGSSARPLTASSGQQSGSVTPSNVLVDPLAKNNQKKLMPIRGSPGGNTSLERVTKSSDILDQESTLAILEGDNVDSTSQEMLIIPEKVQEFGALRSSTIDDYTETRHLLQGGRNRVRKRRNISNHPTGQVLAGSTTARSTESPQVTRRSSRNNSRSNSLTGLSNSNLNSARYTNRDVEKGQIPKSRTEDVKLSQAEYIKQHFPLKKCTRFVKKKNEDDATICECGYTKEQHESDPDYKLNKMLHGSRNALDEGDGGDGSAEENIPWEFEKDIKSFHCNACYGSIKFVGGHKNMSKYCRIPWDVAHPKLVVDYLVEYENVAPPNLIISIVGGAKNFKLDKWSGRWKRIINEGIIKVGKQAGAWLITGGSNVGVMRAVGEAVEAAQTKQWVDNKRLKDVHCIGIASWGYTANNDQLFLNEKDNKGKVKCGVVQYESSHMIPGKGKPVHLNPNHTHFLLVDDGSQGYGGGKEEGEYKFRAKFEEYISATHSQEYIDYETPAVMLVVGAQGMGSIEQAVGALEMGIPVVICINTGAATNLVEAAVKMSNNPKLSYEVDIAPHMEEELKKAYKYKMSNIEQTIRCHMAFIKSVIEHKKIVSFFDFQQSDELDKAIYTALFDADLDDTSIEKSVIQERKLNFAYDWNRLDIAEKIIVNGDLKLKALHELMSDALIENKPEFVEKLFQHDFNLGDYLSVKTLEELYNEETPISYLFKALIKIKGEPANSFLGIYTKQKIGDEEVWFTMQDVKKLVEMMTGYPYEYNRERKPEDVEDKLDHPYMDLFIWAVLSARQKMALQIWEYTPNAISNAMLACHLYRYFRDNIPLEDTLSKEIYSKYAEEFEERASALLTQCYKTDPNYAQAIVEERHFRWGKLNTLNMAAASDSKNFISHPCCQMALGGEWKRGLLNPGWQIVLFLFLPFLIPTKLVQFMEDVNKLIRENKLDNYKKEYQADVNCCIMGFKKWYKFYQTPFVKFTGHAICHVGFIILMSFFILFDVNPYTPSFTEYLIFGWIATLVGEEIRQIATSYAQGFKGKMTRWFFDPWNIMDLLALLLFLVGFSLRVTIVVDPGNVNHELIVNVMRTSYCLSCLVWYMRILNIFLASSYFGPKLIMITRMLLEVIKFMIIMGVFVISYGVAAQALQHPSRTPYWNIFRDIIYMPYWQIYGELFLETVVDAQKEGCNGTQVLSSTGDWCPQKHWLVDLLLGCYLLIANVLLLNLLIALFSNVYNHVEENAGQYWKSAMYTLVQEYKHKPALAPPFIVFEHIFLLIRAIWRKCTNVKEKHGKVYTRKFHQTLLHFEADAMEDLIKAEEKKEQESVEIVLNKIYEGQEMVCREKQEQQDNEAKARAVKQQAYLRNTSSSDNDSDSKQKKKPMLISAQYSRQEEDLATKFQNLEEKFESLEKTLQLLMKKL